MHVIRRERDHVTNSGEYLGGSRGGCMECVVLQGFAGVCVGCGCVWGGVSQAQAVCLRAAADQAGSGGISEEKDIF